MLRFSVLKTNYRSAVVCCLLLALCSLLLAPIQSKSQVKYEMEAQAIGTTNGVVPFWMRSNQYGSIPITGASTSFLGRAVKEYNFKSDSLNHRKLWDWGMGFEARINSNVKNNEFILTEGYLKGKLGPFEIKAGRSKETMGLTGDSSLTSGSFAISGNALGIPKIDISIPKYFKLPILSGVISLKGSFSHGWIGTTPTNDTINKVPMLDNFATTYFHQKSLYGKIGKPSWRINLLGGINHQVFWSNEAKLYGKGYSLTPFGTFMHVVTGRPYGNEVIPRSKIGNQLGSIDGSFELRLNKLILVGYRQNIYDVGALFRLANLRDGLNGLSIRNLSNTKSNLTWNTIVFEVLNTTNQAGETWSKLTNSGDEDYYNNYFYLQGWSYSESSLGTPFITLKRDAREGLTTDPNDRFVNNRVTVFHLGTEISLNQWRLKAKLSTSKNKGTFATSEGGRSRGSERFPPRYGVFSAKHQTSAYTKAVRQLKNGMSFMVVVAIDRGGLLYDSYGMLLGLSKSFY